MKTVTLPKTKYEILKKQASLYEAVLRYPLKPNSRVEEYSSRRVKEFLREDRIDKQTKARIKRLLKSF